ncbi:MAG TPA: hypothetical protein ENI08_00855 [Candidatus Dependentiae bacterium]|nr:hypothetical protein [Candidatus Dependentiae bacterium]
MKEHHFDIVARQWRTAISELKETIKKSLTFKNIFTILIPAAEMAVVKNNNKRGKTLAILLATALSSVLLLTNKCEI